MKDAVSVNKKLLVAVVVALAASSAVAGDVTTEIYGRAHVSVDMLDNGNDSGANVSSNSSRIGFRANTEIAPGLTGKMQLEQEVRFDNGAGNFATRDSFVGLEGGFGGIRLGFFDTPTKKVRGAVDLFSDQIGDMRNLTRLNRVRGGYTADFDTRFQNGVHYYSPSFNGLSADVDYSTNTDADTNPPSDKATAYSVGATYKTKELYVGLAYQQNEAFANSAATRLAASYTMGDLKLTGLYQLATLKAKDASNNPLPNLDVSTYGVGASYKLGDKTTLKGQYLMLSDDRNNSDANMLALGVDYAMSKAFRLLFAYAMTSNDDNAAYRMSDSGHGDAVATVAGETASGFSAGFQYDF
ncbi:MAG: porin [Chromatiales bacterium]|nr:porin [Chromatiales bacterium]